MAKALKVPVEYIDFTLPGGRQGQYSFEEEDLVVLGMPTYAGRVPNKALPFLRELFDGNGALAVSIVTFGNRDFDSSLTELVEETSGGDNGKIINFDLTSKFRGIADDAAVADHTIVSHMHILHQQVAISHNGLTL
jgi:hypothetical protein